MGLLGAAAVSASFECHNSKCQKGPFTEKDPIDEWWYQPGSEDHTVELYHGGHAPCMPDQGRRRKTIGLDNHPYADETEDRGENQAKVLFTHKHSFPPGGHPHFTNLVIPKARKSTISCSQCQVVFKKETEWDQVISGSGIKCYCNTDFCQDSKRQYKEVSVGAQEVPWKPGTHPAFKDTRR